MKTLATLSVLGLCTIGASAQIVVTDSLSTSGIAELLEGMNVSISNVEVNCNGAAMGHFVGTSEMAISEGLVLTTGSADQVAGDVSSFASASYFGVGDADLEADAGFITYDACVLEFDCIPFGDTLLFNYAFGSEEYQEFVGSAFNDIFAIYISGTGFPFPTNVAKLPDGTPVAINNVNAMSNSVYFHDNEAVPGQYVSYDGFTTDLTAFAEVHPGDTYHFKVAIADASDAIFDSGVFLEAFSFRSVSMSTGLQGSTLPEMVLTRYAGDLQVDLPTMRAGATLEVLNIMGQVVKRLPVTGSRTTIDLSTLDQGAYILRVQGRSDIAPQRFVND